MKRVVIEGPAVGDAYSTVEVEPFDEQGFVTPLHVLCVETKNQRARSWAKAYVDEDGARKLVDALTWWLAEREEKRAPR